MNEQEAFDKMVTHLRKQGIRSEREDQLCLLRSNGLKCAIGALITDEEYEPKMENLPLHDLVPVVPVLGALLYEFLWDMREVHDNTPPESWEQGFEEVAANYGLEYTAP